MPEALLLLLGLLLAGVVVAAPLVRRGHEAAPAVDDEAITRSLRHRVALDALRDVEADHRAGSLDDAAFARQRAEAETRAAATLAALEPGPPPVAVQASPAGKPATRTALVLAAVIGAALVAGALVPATGVANQTVVNEQLLAAQEADEARQERIAALLQRVAADSSDAEALSDLADAYLAGSTGEELVRAAVALRLLIDLEPDRADAYERIVAAYIRAGDYTNARSALSSYESVDTSDPVEVAFFDGLIALRGESDPGSARAAFDRFLELAPEDPRAGMVRGLRDEAVPPES